MILSTPTVGHPEARARERALSAPGLVVSQTGMLPDIEAPRIRFRPLSRKLSMTEQWKDANRHKGKTEQKQAKNDKNRAKNGWWEVSHKFMK